MKTISIWYFFFSLLGCGTYSETSSTVDFGVIPELSCVDLGEDEYGAPQHLVVLNSENGIDTLGSCLACSMINKLDYSDYDIPTDAADACGGWWAGGGDYFYVIETEEGTLEVYTGWQDEGQIELTENPYNWKLTKTISFEK